MFIFKEKKQTEIRNALNRLPPKVLAEVLSYDDLELFHEQELVEHIKNYIKFRTDITKNIDLHP